MAWALCFIGLGLFLLLLMVGLTLFLFLSSIRNTSTNENRNIVAKEVGNIFNISKGYSLNIQLFISSKVIHSDPTSSTFRPTTVSPLITEDNRTTTTFVYYPGKVKRETATNYEQSQGRIDSQSFILLLLALICVTLT